jgi:hypothetical protein
MSQIPLSNAPGVFATVDAEDVEQLSQSRWLLAAVGYAVASGGRRYMHREILGLVPGDGLQCDHINGDKLDNRRSNLRAVPQGENVRAFVEEPRQVVAVSRRVLEQARTGRGSPKLGLTGKRISRRFHSEDVAAAAVNAFWVEHGYAAPNVIEGEAA